ncbi:hypothetical protein IAQ61_011354 [Plenodomus lingam]|uniref:uncharacterized protein n=1 Tax=Leptosphaeria maculans TaxID=5022 RepID=UPI003319B9EF|nr:hypothetical protein IAQ61_011354 [Plenodomus lingam]
MMGSGFPCNAEFWIMSIYLPVGIALFHASNSQFLDLASRQKQLAHLSLKEQDVMTEKAHTSRSRWRKIISGAERPDSLERTLIYIGIGLTAQLQMTYLTEPCSGFPIADIIKDNSLRQETLDAIAKWEARQTVNKLHSGAPEWSSSSPASSATAVNLNGRNSLKLVSFESQKSDMLTMNALENALRTNAVPLLRFACLKDFSFLINLADWRGFWFSSKLPKAQHQRDQFIAATRIFAHFVSDSAEFPINISSKEKKRLQNVFENAANLLYRHQRGSITSVTSDNATPFDDMSPSDRKNSFSSTAELQNCVNLDALGRANYRAVTRMQEPHIDELLSDLEVPEAFEESIFDAAESEIKYLVLTNTWPKFVNFGHASSQMSKDENAERGTWVKKILCSL